MVGPEEEMLWDSAAGSRDRRSRTGADVTAWREGGNPVGTGEVADHSEGRGSDWKDLGSTGRGRGFWMGSHRA